MDIQPKRLGISTDVGTFAADCVPLLFVDPAAGVFGAAHAGWRGTLTGIAKHMIDTMKKRGAQEKNIFVSIGPHIEACCYTVPEKRAKQFTQAFHDTHVVMGSGGNWRVSLGLANYVQLIEKGIVPSHIDAP